MKVKRTRPLIEPDIKRVLLKPFDISSPNRTKRIVDEIISMKENIVLKEYSEIRIKFGDVHKGLIKFLKIDLKKLLDR